MGQKKSIAALRLKDRVEASILVRVVAEPRVAGQRIKTRIAMAAERLGWSETRTSEIWRRRARVDPWELDQLRNWKPE